MGTLHVLRPACLLTGGLQVWLFEIGPAQADATVSTTPGITDLAFLLIKR